MKLRLPNWIVLQVLFFCIPCLAEEYGNVTTQKVAEGVYLFSTTPYGDVGMSGNSVAILSEDSVLVFDSNGLPETAEKIIGEIRKLTDKPVKYLVNSHWHWDHWHGNQAYRDAFPDIQIIAHKKTVEQMKEVEPRWNGDGLKNQLPAYVDSIGKKLEETRARKAPEQEVRELEELYDMDSRFLKQKTELRRTLPNLTFAETLMLRSGNREIEISHASAITVGDAYVFLPKEKILITGDILLDPYPYAIGGTYPSSWLKKLEEFDSLDPAIIIPGHGAPQKEDFLLKNISLFQAIVKRVADSRASGSTLEQTKEVIGKDYVSIASRDWDYKRREGKRVQSILPGYLCVPRVSRVGESADRSPGRPQVELTLAGPSTITCSSPSLTESSVYPMESSTVSNGQDQRRQQSRAHREELIRENLLVLSSFMHPRQLCFISGTDKPSGLIPFWRLDAAYQQFRIVKATGCHLD